MGLSLHPHILTDNHQILHTWLRPPYLPTSHIWSSQDRPRCYFSPYSQSYHSAFFFLSLYAKSFYRPRDQAVEPILTHDTPTDAYSRRVVLFRGQNTVFSHIHPQNLPKPHFWTQMESLWEIHICITAWCIEIRCWNLAGCLILPNTWSILKSSSVRVLQGASSPHIKFWDTLFISETNRARKLKFGTLVDIYEY